MQNRIKTKSTLNGATLPVLALALQFFSDPALAQRPGDRQFPNKMNPAYVMTNLLPEFVKPDGFKPEVTGLDTLSDGRLVISTREDNQYDYAPPTSGKIYLVSGYKTVVNGKETYSAGGLTYKVIAEGLNEPMGLVVVKDTIYTITKQELIQFADPNKDGVYESKKTVCTGFPKTGTGPGDVFEWNFGLVHHQGVFYSQLSSYHNVDEGGQNTRRGGVIAMRTNNTFELLGTGIRRSNGVGLGPNYDVFTTDNQGEWVATNRLIHAQKNKWWGYRNGPNYNPDKYPLTKPAVWMPYFSSARSPSEPSLVIQGPYRGQMITGDCTDPNLRRMFVEKINGEYQGAVFHFAAMNKSPANRFLMRRNGDIIVGGLGSFTDGHTDWNWGGGTLYGLQVLAPSGTVPFDMLAVRAVQGGFDIEFTKPVGWGAENKDNYEIKTWGYISERSYSSSQQNEYGMGAKAVTLSPDRKRVFLAIDNLPAGNVVYIRLKESIQSADNEQPWITEAWYTLNALGSVQPLQPLAEVWVPPIVGLRGVSGGSNKHGIRFDASMRKVEWSNVSGGQTQITIRDISGSAVGQWSLGAKEKSFLIPRAQYPVGVYSLELRTAGVRTVSRVVLD